MRRRFRSATAATAVAALASLTACTPQAPLVDDPFNKIIETATGTMPLPPEARYEPADSRPARLPGDVVPEPTPAPGIGPAQDRIPEIVERGRIIIGVDQSLNLLGFRDATTGELAGFEVALAQEIARDIFGDPDASSSGTSTPPSASTRCARDASTRSCAPCPSPRTANPRWTSRRRT
nr:hypothetical protein [Corynebacterium xerosis]